MYLTETFQTMPFGRPVSTPSLFPRFRPLLRSDHRGRRPGELFREAQRGSRRGRRWTDGRADEWFFIPATSYGDRPTDRPNATVAECDVRGVEWALERASRLVTHCASHPATAVPARRVGGVRRRPPASLVAGRRRRRALLPRKAVFGEVLSRKQVRATCFDFDVCLFGLEARVQAAALK